MCKALAATSATTRSTISPKLSDTLSWVKGKHNLKIGVDWQAPQQNIVDFNNVGGTWGFNASGTNIGSGNTSTVLGIPNATTGTSFATLLLGYPTAVSIAPAVIPYQYRWKYWAGFLQDDWKITSKLTLNIGVRYQIEVPRSEKHHLQGYFVDQPVTLPTGAQQQGYIQLDGLGGDVQHALADALQQIEPRFGFAYRLPAIHSRAPGDSRRVCHQSRSYQRTVQQRNSRSESEVGILSH